MSNHEAVKTLDLGVEYNLPGFSVVLDPAPQERNASVKQQAYHVGQVLVPKGGVYEPVQYALWSTSRAMASTYRDSLALSALGIPTERVDQILFNDPSLDGSRVTAQRLNRLRRAGTLREEGFHSIQGLTHFAFTNDRLLRVTHMVERQPGSSPLNALSAESQFDMRERALQILRCAADDMSRRETAIVLGLKQSEVSDCYTRIFNIFRARTVQAAVMMSVLNGIELSFPE